MLRSRQLLLAGVVATCLVATACSRLTFVKADASRGASDRVAPEYNLRDEPRDIGAAVARRHAALAEQRLRAGQLDDAEKEAKAAVKADPRSAAGHTLLALVHQQRGRSEAAGSHYAKAAEVAPESGAMLNNYGAWLCANGRAPESLAWFDRALADPRYRSRASAMANAGSCAATAGQFDRVERDLRGALALDPGNLVALAAMAEQQFRVGRYLEARAFSERRLAAAPASAESLLLASRIEDKLGDKAAAARYVQRLEMEFPQARTLPFGETSTP
ncbi:type IV pilus biogenesis/stability protein PilW [Luteimonas vadosa]|uniref:Type IV pilus biogenesis/stability protein PilW n=1 Tax=Luteimonas vadosa TaxID=1165507 RepID=A0ABP9E341_9GAMM